MNLVELVPSGSRWPVGPPTQHDWPRMEELVPSDSIVGPWVRSVNAVARAVCSLRGHHDEGTVKEHYRVYSGPPDQDGVRPTELRYRFIVECNTCCTKMDA